MQHVRENLDTLSQLMLDKVKATIDDTGVTGVKLRTDMRSVWDRKEYLYQWQLYQVTKVIFF
jgi:hypothetical protein